MYNLHIADTKTRYDDIYDIYIIFKYKNQVFNKYETLLEILVTYNFPCHDCTHFFEPVTCKMSTSIMGKVQELRRFELL